MTDIEAIREKWRKWLSQWDQYPRDTVLKTGVKLAEAEILLAHIDKLESALDQEREDNAAYTDKINAETEALEAENARLREALEGFPLGLDVDPDVPCVFCGVGQPAKDYGPRYPEHHMERVHDDDCPIRIATAALRKDGEEVRSTFGEASCFGRRTKH